MCTVGLVVESHVAIVRARVRFPDGAVPFLFFHIVLSSVHQSNLRLQSITNLNIQRAFRASHSPEGAGMFGTNTVIL